MALKRTLSEEKARALSFQEWSRTCSRTCTCGWSHLHLQSQPWLLPINSTHLPAGIFSLGPGHLKVGQQADGIALGSSVGPNCAVMCTSLFVPCEDLLCLLPCSFYERRSQILSTFSLWPQPIPSGSCIAFKLFCFILSLLLCHRCHTSLPELWPHGYPSPSDLSLWCLLF